jgi:hypothetical protein
MHRYSRSGILPLSHDEYARQAVIAKAPRMGIKHTTPEPSIRFVPRQFESERSETRAMRQDAASTLVEAASCRFARHIRAPDCECQSPTFGHQTFEPAEQSAVS